MNFFRKINISSFSPKIAKWYPFRPSFQRFPNDIQRMLYRESTATFQWIHWLLLFYLCVLHDKGQTGRSGVFVSELLRNFSNQGDELILNVVFFVFFSNAISRIVWQVTSVWWLIQREYPMRVSGTSLPHTQPFWFFFFKGWLCNK